VFLSIGRRKVEEGRQHSRVLKKSGSFSEKGGWRGRLVGEGVHTKKKIQVGRVFSCMASCGGLPLRHVPQFLCTFFPENMFLKSGVRRDLFVPGKWPVISWEQQTVTT
jgi:hypothetical protein